MQRVSLDVQLRALLMRTGILGGTFDPVHYGHLLLAECCREQCRLDRVWFLPAAAPPHKPAEGVAPAADRVEMLKLAIGGHQPFEVCLFEIERGGVNYTADTLAALQREQPDDELFFLLGADSLHDLPRWRRPEEICRLVTLAVVSRPGAEAPNYDSLTELVDSDRLENFRRHLVRMPQIDISGREIRARVADGRSIRFQTPRAVEKYIQTQGLYKPEIRNPKSETNTKF